MKPGDGAPRELTYRDGWKRGKISRTQSKPEPMAASSRLEGDMGLPKPIRLLLRSPRHVLPKGLPWLLLLMPAAVFGMFLWLVYRLARLTYE
ncbi:MULTISPECIES: hypothetical protein [Paenibacillus]|uniref:hypothetical protein n=1 Tax=Paenibacillus TaxID=44249 RepID=UPI0022B9031F|nr:hypothetical protein [Paenibacillus caseinilyticus]MCZ8517989.1 hypothetical protein [Paenibacillus caseinilyticus]